MMRATRATLPPVSSSTIEGIYATGYWLFMQQRVAHALSVFRAMIHLSPYDERGWLALGTCYEAQDQGDVALHVYASSLRMLVAAPRCQLAQARILRAHGRPREAQRALVEAGRAAQRSPDMRAPRSDRRRMGRARVADAEREPGRDDARPAAGPPAAGAGPKDAVTPGNAAATWARRR